ncbi:response regulator [candidate division KSB1 bacterium]|nr:response regulator [candidate division KSB1 bacterium]
MEPQRDVLVVDDEPVVIESVKRVLGSRWTCEGAPDIDTAICKLWQNSFSVVLVDLLMPGPSGIEFLGMVKDKMPDTLLILFTGYSTSSTVLKAMQLVVFDFLSKPFDFDELSSIVSRAMRYKEWRQNKMSELEQFRHHLAAPHVYKMGDHCWVNKKDKGAFIGLGETFLPLYDHIQKIKLNVTFYLKQGEPCCYLIDDEESVHQVWTPVNGQVIEMKKTLDSTNWHLNPLDQWILSVEPNNWEADIQNL